MDGTPDIALMQLLHTLCLHTHTDPLVNGHPDLASIREKCLQKDVKVCTSLAPGDMDRIPNRENMSYTWKRLNLHARRWTGSRRASQLAVCPGMCHTSRWKL